MEGWYTFLYVFICVYGRTFRNYKCFRLPRKNQDCGEVMKSFYHVDSGDSALKEYLGKSVRNCTYRWKKKRTQLRT